MKSKFLLITPKNNLLLVFKKMKINSVSQAKFIFVVGMISAGLIFTFGLLLILDTEHQCGVAIYSNYVYQRAYISSIQNESANANTTSFIYNLVVSGNDDTTSTCSIASSKQYNVAQYIHVCAKYGNNNNIIACDTNYYSHSVNLLWLGILMVSTSIVLFIGCYSLILPRMKQLMDEQHHTPIEEPDTAV